MFSWLGENLDNEWSVKPDYSLAIDGYRRGYQGERPARVHGAGSDVCARARMPRDEGSAGVLYRKGCDEGNA